MLALGLVLLTGLGCSEEADPPPIQPSTGPGAGGPGGGATGGAGGAGGGTGTGGFVEASCEDTAATPIEVYSTGSALGLRQLVEIGGRWLASSPDGWVTFDLDGLNADPGPTALADKFNVIADEGEVAGIAAGNDNWVGYQRLGPTGPVTGIRSLANLDSDGVTTAATAAGDAVTVWGYNGKLTMRLVDASGGVPNDAVDVALGAYSGALRLRSAGRDDRVGLVWFGSDVVGIFQTWFLPLSPAGPLADRVLLHETTPVQHDLHRVVATDKGFMVLLSDDDLTPRLHSLDEMGVEIESLTLAGVTAVYDLATNGNELAVLAGRSTGEPQMRVFDAALDPVGPWICVSGPQNLAVPPTIAANGSGWAVLAQGEAGATSLIRVDATGAGAL